MDHTTYTQDPDDPTLIHLANLYVGPRHLHDDGIATIAAEYLTDVLGHAVAVEELAYSTEPWFLEPDPDGEGNDCYQVDEVSVRVSEVLT